MTEPSAASLRVVSWNLRSLRDDEEAVVEGLRALRPDVVCLQEVPRFGRWRQRLARLARRSDLLYTCGGRPTGGVALLTALRIDVTRTFEWRLPKTPSQYQRGVAVADLRVGGAPLRIASTHLGLTAAEREAHAGELRHLLARGGPSWPVVLAGDLNETQSGAAWRTLVAAGLRDAYAEQPAGGELTFPSARPCKRIDAVLVGDGIEVLGCGVPAELDPALLARATDHCPVRADLRLAGCGTPAPGSAPN